MGSHGTMVLTWLGLGRDCDEIRFVVYYFSAIRHLYLCQLCSDFSHDNNKDSCSLKALAMFSGGPASMISLSGNPWLSSLLKLRGRDRPAY